MTKIHEVNGVKYIEVDRQDEYFACHECSKVEEPIEATNKTDRVLSNEKHIIELSKTVATLQRTVEFLTDQISINTDNIRTIGEDVTKADYKAGQALTTAKQFAETIEMLEDDVIMLDERTQPLVADGVSEFATELTDMIERKINENEAIRERFK